MNVHLQENLVLTRTRDVGFWRWENGVMVNQRLKVPYSRWELIAGILGSAFLAALAAYEFEQGRDAAGAAVCIAIVLALLVDVYTRRYVPALYVERAPAWAVAFAILIVAGGCAILTFSTSNELLIGTGILGILTLGAMIAANYTRELPDKRLAEGQEWKVRFWRYVPVVVFVLAISAVDFDDKPKQEKPRPSGSAES